MKKIILLLLLFFSIKAYNQVLNISGFITDKSTGENLIGANIYSDNSNVGVASNNFGYYSFFSNHMEVNLNFSYVGYKTFKLSLRISKDTIINVELDPNLELDEVVVKENKLEDELKSTQMSMLELPAKDLKQLPVLMGEPDVMRTLQLMPGVHTGGEGTAGLFVRGGSPDQNQILLDGIQIYNAYHLFGFFSVFNADAIQNIKLYKGAFPAEYGGRVSSVLDIRMKEGNTKKLKGGASVGLIASSIKLEGPLKNENTTFLVSARRTYIDLLSRPFIKKIADGSISDIISMMEQ